MLAEQEVPAYLRRFYDFDSQKRRWRGWEIWRTCESCGRTEWAQVVGVRYAARRGTLTGRCQRCPRGPTYPLVSDSAWGHAGFTYVSAPDHPRANSRGMAPEHILVMEQKLGRYLNDNERVYHEDDNLAHNKIDNLILVLKKVPISPRAYPEAWKTDGSYWGSDYWDGSWRRYPHLYGNKTEKELLREALKSANVAQARLIHYRRAVSALRDRYGADVWLLDHIAETAQAIIGHDLAHAISLVAKDRGYDI